MRVKNSLIAVLVIGAFAERGAIAQTRPAASGIGTVIGGAVGGAVGGADVSSLLDIEKAGGVFRDEGGKAGDEIQILRGHGCEIFRVRLFVKPNPLFSATGGATQDLATAVALGKRIKAAGGRFLLDLHYSDTWADPGHQVKPREWEGLSFEEVEKKLESYTEETIRSLQAAGAGPDMVQVGNEITSGIVWPDGRVSHGPKEKEPEQWGKLVKLLKAGIRGVRACEGEGKRIPVVLHVHGGGRERLPQWFFGELMKYGGTGLDFDVIGLSFYPTWKDSLGVLKTNMDELIASYGKPVLLAEVGYPFAPVDRIEGKESMEWPMTPEGQKAYLEATKAVLAGAREGKGLGYVWWYSDAIEVPGGKLRIWREGNEALFDHEGKAVPAMAVFSGK